MLSQRLEQWGWSQRSTDRALFERKNERGETVGIMPIHVDDSKIRCDEKTTKELFALIGKDDKVNLTSVENQRTARVVS